MITDPSDVIDQVPPDGPPKIYCEVCNKTINDGDELNCDMCSMIICEGCDDVELFVFFAQCAVCN